MDENTKDDFLIRRVIYPDRSPLTFGKSYCKYNPLLLKTLIGATVELELQSVEKDKDFWIKLKTTWLNNHWSKEINLYENYKNQSAKDDFFNFGYHIGIWDGNFNLTELAKETWSKYESTKKSNEKDNDESLKPFREYFDIFLRNFVVIYKEKSYNPLKSILEKLKDENSQENEFTLSYKNNLKKFLEMTFDLDLENELPLWKCRIFFLLLSSTTYFKESESNKLELKITRKKLIEELEKCEDVYDNKNVTLIKSNILNHSDKSYYLTKKNKYEDEKIENNIPFKYKMINEHHQIIYYGAHNTGKSFTLNQKINNFFDNFKLIYMDESINFQTLFWEEDGDDVKIGLFIDFLIQAFSHPDEIFLFAFENIDKISNDLFDYLNTLSKRNEDGFSQNPQRIPNEKIFESIKKKINKNSWEKFEDLVFLDEIKINSVNQIFFPPNFYVWATTSNLDWFNSTPKKYWNQIHLDINDNEDFIKGVKLKIKFPNRSTKKCVFWNDFRKIINGFLIDELELNEDKLIGVFSINPQTLEDLKDDIDALSAEIIDTVLSHLYYKINKFDSLLIFKEEYSKNFSQIQKNFSNYGIEIFRDSLKNKIQKLNN